MDHYQPLAWQALAVGTRRGALQHSQQLGGVSPAGPLAQVRMGASSGQGAKGWRLAGEGWEWHQTSG